MVEGDTHDGSKTDQDNQDPDVNEAHEGVGWESQQMLHVCSVGDWLRVPLHLKGLLKKLVQGDQGLLVEGVLDILRQRQESYLIKIRKRSLICYCTFQSWDEGFCVVHGQVSEWPQDEHGLVLGEEPGGN